MGLLLASLVIFPSVECCFDVMLLTTLGAAAQQNDEVAAISSKVDSVSRTEV